MYLETEYASVYVIEFTSVCVYNLLMIFHRMFNCENALRKKKPNI